MNQDSEIWVSTSEFDGEEDRTPGEPIKCSHCGGHGVVSGYTLGGTDFTGPEECSHCAGGFQWRYRNGSVAQYYGGPLDGSAPLPN